MESYIVISFLYLGHHNNSLSPISRLEKVNIQISDIVQILDSVMAAAVSYNLVPASGMPV
jgi:hypothetical protein